MVEISQFIDRIGIELHRAGFYNIITENDLRASGKAKRIKNRKGEPHMKGTAVRQPSLRERTS